VGVAHGAVEGVLPGRSGGNDRWTLPETRPGVERGRIPGHRGFESGDLSEQQALPVGLVFGNGPVAPSSPGFETGPGIAAVLGPHGPDGIPRLEYGVDSLALQELSDTSLGKNILITDRGEWDTERIIEAYRSQFLIEDVFKEMKDRTRGNGWPLFHWTASKIRVHGLYCTIAVLLRALSLRRVRQAGLHLSMKRLLAELDAIREAVNIYPRKRGRKTAATQTVLTKTSELQHNLISILRLDKQENSLLG